MGVRLFESHRMEILAEAFVATLKSAAEGGDLDPLVPWTVIPQNPVTGRWLSFYLARSLGISASLDLPLAGRYIRHFFDGLYGPAAGNVHFDRETLLLRICTLLPDLLSLPAFSPVAHFAGDGPESLRLYDLASLLADLYDRSMIYRPELLLAWEEGQGGRDDDPVGPDGWPAILWRALAGPDRPLHRARMMVRFLSGAETPPPGLLPPSLALFGLTGMSPLDLRFFRTLGDRHGCAVDLFFLNPSREYWGDVVRPKRREEAPENEQPYLFRGTPLLSSWGGEFRTVHEALVEIPESHRLFFGEESGSLLGGIQEDILTLFDRGEEIRSGRLERREIPVTDRSVEIVSATGRVREVEMLRDRLLDLFANDPTLTPEDVVVLAPDILPYAGIVRSVFSPGLPGPKEAAGSDEGDPRIPFVISDRRETDASPAFQALLCLLSLPGERITISHLVTLLSVPSIALRFDLGGQKIDRLREILSEGGFRWGRDAEDRSEVAPSVATHSFFWGLDRLLLGYACGEEEPPEGLPVSPVAVTEDSGGEIVGALSRFLWALDRHWERLKDPQPAWRWPDLLATLLEIFFDPEEGDPVLETLFALPGEVREGFSRANFEGEVSSRWMGRHIARMAEGREGRDRFLTGGVTFGRMVPLRSLPFRVVCLLGLNDGDFPRIHHPPSFDWLAARPRPGDRSRREDDRTLFLEAILSARQFLWLSYLGRDSRDGSPKEPSVLLREFEEVLAEGFVGQGGEPLLGQILLQAPVDPLSPDHYGDSPDPRLHSFSRSWRQVLEASRSEEGSSPVFWDPGLRLPEPGPGSEGILLDDLHVFFSNPARFFLLRRMGFSFRTREIELLEDEPFSLTLREIVKGLDLKSFEVDGIPWPPLGPLQLAEGVRHKRDHAGRIGRLLDLSEEAPETLEISLEVGGVRVVGGLSGIRTKASGGRIRVVDLWPGKIYPSHHVTAYLEHLVACRGVPGYAGTLLCGRMASKPEAFLFWSSSPEAEEGLGHFIRAFHKARETPLAFDPEISLAYVRAKRLKASGGGGEGEETAKRQAAMRVWEKDPPPERGDVLRDPRIYPAFWSRRLFAGRPLPLEPDFGVWARCLLSPLILEQQSLDSPWEAR
ncbi:MAG: exodeoxyribonuclease V subunit gamma [Leptospirillia bacterium]